MTKLDYISTPAETPGSRNDGFYEDISHDWEKRAKNLLERRWDRIEHRLKS